MFFRKLPSVSHLRSFGCLCYASALPRIDKFDSRAVPSVFMVYSTTNKGYVLFDLTQQKNFINRDVTFMEYIFPFQSFLSLFLRLIIFYGLLSLFLLMTPQLFLIPIPLWMKNLFFYFWFSYHCEWRTFFFAYTVF